MTLQTLANIAEVLGATTIVGGALFGLVQLREARANRQQAMAVELTRSFYDTDFAHSVELIRGLPDRCSAADLRERGPEYQRAAIALSTTFETLGLLVHREMASYDLVFDLAGGIGLVVWRKLERWTEEYRLEQDQPSWAEWFHWLAIQFEHDSAEKEANPAYLQHAEWRPRR